MPTVAILGGGISGLSAAFRLKKDYGIEAIVLESEPSPGGKAKTSVRDGFICEQATNGWLDKEQAVRDLIRDLGLESRVQPSDRSAERRFIYRDGALREIEMHPVKFMLSSVLPLAARFRLAAEPFVSKRESDDDETLADFAERRLGKDARDILIGPMASGIYAGDPSKMSLRSCFGKVYNLERQHGGLIKGMLALKREKKAKGEDPSVVQAGPSGRLTSLKGGIAELVQALARELGDRLRTGCEVISVSKNEKGGFKLTLNRHPEIDADVVISASPAWAATSFLRALDEDAADSFAAIPYPGLDVVCLGYRAEQLERALDGFGFLVPRKEGKTILGSLWCSSIFPGRAPKGLVLMRTMIGGMMEPQVAGWSEDQVVETVRREIADVVGVPMSEQPVFMELFRHPKAIPQYHVGHGDLVSRIRKAEERHRGFLAGGNSLNGIGVVDCIRESVALANRAAELLRGAQR